MAVRRPKKALRKQPRQERARATVDAILQAAAYILVRKGWAGFTTNHIAERAGVNIASLYQYFPSKETIVAELQRRHVAEGRARFAEALPALTTQPSLADALTLMVRAAVEEHRVAPALHRAFSEELPRSARLEVEDDGSELWRKALAPFMRDVPDRELAGFICRTVIHGVIHEAASQRPDLLAHPALVSEVVALLAPYLQREKADPGAARASSRRRATGRVQ